MADPQAKPDSAQSGAPSIAPPQQKDLLQNQAQAETKEFVHLQHMREDFAHRGERLAVDVPPLFFRLASGLREAAARFNANLGQGLPDVRWTESTAVTLQQTGPNAELVVTISRLKSRFQLTLRYLSRYGKPDLPLIEGYGEYGAQQEGARRLFLRIEGWVENDVTTFWITLDYKRRAIDLAELPDRIVMTVVRQDPVLLERSPYQSQPPPSHL